MLMKHNTDCQWYGRGWNAETPGTECLIASAIIQGTTSHVAHFVSLKKPLICDQCWSMWLTDAYHAGN